MHKYGIMFRIKFDWKLYKRFGFKKIYNDHGYWTDWFTPILPGVWFVNSTEGPP